MKKFSIAVTVKIISVIRVRKRMNLCINERICMNLNERTQRIEMHFTEEEMDTLAWLVKSEIKVQELLVDESDGTLLKQLEELYESFTW